MKAFLIFLFLLISSNSFSFNNSSKSENIMNKIAEEYVKLVLKIGQYDDGYVDAYYGPETWMPKELSIDQKKVFPYSEFKSETDHLLGKIKGLNKTKLSKIEKLRKQYLLVQLKAVKARVEILNGAKMSFDEESNALYGAVAPVYGKEYFEKIINRLETILPGNGTISERVNNFRNEFIIPKDKIDNVFKAAIAEGRKRTLQFIKLPANENFTVEYVTGKSWGAYNWYKGNNFSLIQVNTEQAIYIDRAIDLASHEGYPGHHVYNALLETELVKKKGWVEFCVYPLYSPQSLIAEGTANYGIDMAFPENERLDFEKNVLFPLAGLDSSRIEKYYTILNLTGKLNYATNEAARNFLDGRFTKEQTIDWLKKYSLLSDERAERMFKFIEHYRSYVINYNLGQDIVKNYISKKMGKDKSIGKKWKIFEYIISTPQTPADLLK